MARPREFDPNVALDGAMNVFWAHGYEGASLPLLLTGMGLTRGSFYKAFNDKKSLFLQSLDRYEGHAVTPAVEKLCDPTIKDGTRRIEAVFQSVINAARNGDDRGCLLCSAAAGPAAEDEDIANATHRLLDRLQSAFETAISQSALAAGEESEKTRALGSHLLTHYVGLRILVRSKAPMALLERSAQSVLSVLNT